MHEGWGWAERRWTSVTTDTGIGNPAKATVEKGEQFFKLLAEKIGEFLFDVATTDRDEFYE